jgi:phosphatidylserine/phosphatidylglycerophosphate/cardiolipin synthase-like enzyme
MFLPQGEQAFKITLDLIANARHSIHIATLILGNDETGTAIVHALAKKSVTRFKSLPFAGCAWVCKNS